MYAFVTLGLPDGMIGTAWPSMRRSFGAPLEEVGLVLLAGTVGAVATSSVSGLVVGRVGARVAIMVAAGLGALGGLVAAVSPVFPVLVAAGFLIGTAAGFLDSAVNTMVALSGRNRLLNLVHGCYGIGSTAGPLVVTGALLAVGSWRPAYGFLVGAELLVLAGWWWAGRHGLQTGQEAPKPDGHLAPVPVPAPAPAPGQAEGAVSPAPPRASRLALVVATGLFVFLLYTGLEVGVGQWEPSYDRGPLHMGAGVTGIAVFGYWAALTVVRLGLAVPRHPPSQETVVRWGCLAALAGAAGVWWGPATWVTLTAFVVMGAGLAGVFPALVALTPGRVGEATARHVIGWQIGAAGIGGSVISALFGVIFQHAGFRWMGPCLLIVAVVLVVAAEGLRRLGPPPAVAAA